jgi:hypothetical protein
MGAIGSDTVEITGRVGQHIVENRGQQLSPQDTRKPLV